MIENSVAVNLDNVTQRFRVIHERPDSVRELFSKFFRKKVVYQDLDAVSNVSMRVYPGEIVGIIGRNGSGKSTLMKIIAGVYRPSAGRVTINGTIAPLLELGAGMHPELTGRENILLNGLLMGFSKEDMLQREQKIIQFADIGDFIEVPLKQYSSGMFMRLAFAVATEVDPDILAIDEILGVGDQAFQQKCFTRLGRFRESGKTILLVTHSMDQVESYCTRAVLLEKGQVVADGTPSEVTGIYKRSMNLEEPILVEMPTGHHL
jgi:ABC-type polysaccharide/polyol phosphate transport system ATPase subunit